MKRSTGIEQPTSRELLATPSIIILKLPNESRPVWTSMTGFEPYVAAKSGDTVVPHRPARTATSLPRSAIE